MRRRLPTLRQKLAAALLAIPDLIPAERRDKGTEAILKTVQFHHWRLPYADGGTNEPDNLVPMRIADHEHETRTKTVPMIAKGKRIRKTESAHEARMLAKAGREANETPDPAWLKPTKRRWPERKMQGRGFQGSRKFNGDVTWRKK